MSLTLTVRDLDYKDSCLNIKWIIDETENIDGYKEWGVVSTG